MPVGQERLREPRASIALLVAACMVGGFGVDLAAQVSAPVAVGDRVRVGTISGQVRIGLLNAVTSDALELDDDRDGQRVSIPLPSVSRFEVSRGEGSKAVTGLLVGGLGGLAVGALLCSTTDTCSIVSDNDARGGVIGISGAVGVLLGALAGSTIRTDRWEEVPVGPRVMGVAPRRLFALRLSVGRPRGIPH